MAPLLVYITTKLVSLPIESRALTNPTAKQLTGSDYSAAAVSETKCKSPTSSASQSNTSHTPPSTISVRLPATRRAKNLPRPRPTRAPVIPIDCVDHEDSRRCRQGNLVSLLSSSSSTDSASLTAAPSSAIPSSDAPEWWTINTQTEATLTVVESTSAVGEPVMATNTVPTITTTTPPAKLEMSPTSPSPSVSSAWTSIIPTPTTLSPGPSPKDWAAIDIPLPIAPRPATAGPPAATTPAETPETEAEMVGLGLSTAHATATVGENGTPPIPTANPVPLETSRPKNLRILTILLPILLISLILSILLTFLILKQRRRRRRQSQTHLQTATAAAAAAPALQSPKVSEMGSVVEFGTAECVVVGDDGEYFDGVGYPGRVRRGRSLRTRVVEIGEWRGRGDVGLELEGRDSRDDEEGEKDDFGLHGG